MKNIILIGMPGTGKSVVGRALARRLGYTFLDVDDRIVEQAGMTLPEILRTQGLEAFLEIEGQVGQALECENTVIATGGSMVLSQAAMEHLRENGVTVWLETPLSQICDRMPEDLTDRGIAAVPGMTIRQIYEQREPLYGAVCGCDCSQPGRRGRHGAPSGADSAHGGHPAVRAAR